jgi:pimeloyl-ACP methyl ester carboxylesterase
MSVRYRSAAVAGVNVAYREAGDPANPALLLLHGFPASSFMYRHLLAVLADRFHLIAPDYPGFGNSEAPDPDDWPYTFEHLTDTIEALVDHLELSRYGLFLQDYGAPVGFRLALRRPEAVDFLVVQNGSAYEEGFTGDEIAGLIRAFHTTRAEPSPRRLTGAGAVWTTQRLRLEDVGHE